jgi:hypothetical protein
MTMLRLATVAAFTLISHAAFAGGASVVGVLQAPGGLTQALAVGKGSVSVAPGGAVTVHQSGSTNALGSIQAGKTNSLTVTQAGRSNSGWAYQRGKDNTLIATQTGSSNRFTGWQRGPNNQAGLAQTGFFNKGSINQK